MFNWTRSKSAVHGKTMYIYPDSDLSLEEMRLDQRFDRPYRKTFDFAGDYIDDYQKSLATAKLQESNRQMIDIGIDGWLLPPDALKLYEMAYYAEGQILELGTFMGLSTTVVANAISRSPTARTLTTIDLSSELTAAAKRDMAARGELAIKYVTWRTADGVASVQNYAAERRQFGFAFIDHSHMYEHVLPTCRELSSIISPGGFVLFHDYNDPRNPDESNKDYGVFQAVHDGLDLYAFEFFGVFGCTGLFRRRS